METCQTIKQKVPVKNSTTLGKVPGTPLFVPNPPTRPQTAQPSLS